ncbi:predicted protein [Nematostella vectensis]|nr:predicted protein [Nematostella vectensis]|eukprot:XP_001623918.1 predicted protein [Nematostella vectensis]
MDKHEIAEKEEYLLTMKEISSCQINASLVVLSCCHSGRGQIRAEGVMGLARAFLAAGARSVLATLWTIGDNATLEFMERFYRHLASGLSTSASLKRTIRDTISMNDKYSHPYARLFSSVMTSLYGRDVEGKFQETLEPCNTGNSEE